MDAGHRPGLGLRMATPTRVIVGLLRVGDARRTGSARDLADGAAIALFSGMRSQLDDRRYSLQPTIPACDLTVGDNQKWRAD